MKKGAFSKKSRFRIREPSPTPIIFEISVWHDQTPFSTMGCGWGGHHPSPTLQYRPTAPSQAIPSLLSLLRVLLLPPQIPWAVL